jgi:antitoxin Phd
MANPRAKAAGKAGEQGTSSDTTHGIQERNSKPVPRPRARDVLLERAVGSRGTSTAPPPAAASGPTVYMTSTEAQNGFGRVLDTVARDVTVLITKRNAPQAVVMSVERYRELTGVDSPDLELLTHEFDEMVRRMQTPEVREAVDAAFWATPEEVSRAAVAAAKREGR